jgi:hypothetical protein
VESAGSESSAPSVATVESSQKAEVDFYSIVIETSPDSRNAVS